MQTSDASYDPWYSFPEVTRRDEIPADNPSTLYSVFKTIITPVTFFQDKLNLKCVACGAPRKINGHQVWETSDLGWWDFQRRRVKSLWLAKSVYSRIKDAMATWDELEEAGNLEEAEEMWYDVNVQCAKEIRIHSEESKGMFVKATQQMSTMHGVLPDIYIEEFVKTTEALPISSPEEVFRVLERGLGRSPREAFCAFDRYPIASASIGQVHKALLETEEGRHQLLAVKVQHEGVEDLFMEDLATLGAIAEQVAYWAPEMDFRKAVQEAEEVIPRELDFQLEMEALARAQNILKEYKSPVLVPAVHEKLCSKEVLVMDFIDAGPVTNLSDAEFCTSNDLDKKQIVRELLDAFAILVFREGLIHGDPHAGNVRLKLAPQARGGAVAVILDWGMTRSLSHEERMSLAKFFHSLANLDLNGVFEALDFLGFQFNPELLTDALMDELVGRMRSAMKDTISKEQTRQNTRNNYKELKAKQKEAEESGVDLSNLLREFPKCILFFLRMCECMRGLCVACQVEDIPVLEIFSSHARDAFKDCSKQSDLTQSLRIFRGPKRTVSSASAASVAGEIFAREESSQDSPRKGSPRKFLSPRDWASPREASSVVFERPSSTQRKRLKMVTNRRLEDRVEAALKQLSSELKIIGAQVAVVEGGSAVCNVPYGTLSTIDMRDVTRRTRFPLLDATAGLASLALMRALRRGSFSSLDAVLDTPLRTMWPNFAGGSSSVTLAELLAHSAGVQNAYPKNFTLPFLNDPRRVQRHFEATSPPEAGTTQYSYMLQTLLLAKFSTDLSPEESLQAWIMRELDCPDFELAAPRGKEAVICRDLPSLSRVSMTEVTAAREKRQGSLLKKDDDEAGESLGLIDAAIKNPMSFDPLQANITTYNKELKVAPFRAGLCLGASAMGLASVLASQEVRDDIESLDGFKPFGEDTTALGWLLTGGATQFTAGGLQILEVRPSGFSGRFSSSKRGFGIVSGMGPCVLHFPDICEGGLTISILVNNVLRGREAAAQLVATVLEEYGYVPTWTRMPLRVIADAGRLASDYPTLLPVFEQLRRATGDSDDSANTSTCSSAACGARGMSTLVSCNSGWQKLRRQITDLCGSTETKRGDTATPRRKEATASQTSSIS